MVTTAQRNPIPTISGGSSGPGTEAPRLTGFHLWPPPSADLAAANETRICFRAHDALILCGRVSLAASAMNSPDRIQRDGCTLLETSID